MENYSVWWDCRVFCTTNILKPLPRLPSSPSPGSPHSKTFPHCRMAARSLRPTACGEIDQTKEKAFGRAKSYKTPQNNNFLYKTRGLLLKIKKERENFADPITNCSLKTYCPGAFLFGSSDRPGASAEMTASGVLGKLLSTFISASCVRSGRSVQKILQSSLAPSASTCQCKRTLLPKDGPSSLKPKSSQETASQSKCQVFALLLWNTGQFSSHTSPSRAEIPCVCNP